MPYSKVTPNILIAGLMVLFSSNALATAGGAPLGYGPKSTAMLGAVVALPQDALTASRNPAGMGLVGERVDVSIKLLSPTRDAEYKTSAVGASFDIKEKSENDYFLIPNLGFTKKINDKVWAGVSIYGNGGTNTLYENNIYDETYAVLIAAAAGTVGSLQPGTGTGMPNTDTLGVDIAQVIIAPTLTYQMDQKNTLGVSLLLGVQRFKAYGLGILQCFTPSGLNNNPTACAAGGAGPLTPGFIGSTKLTNQGYDWSYGAGVKVGWLGQVHPRLTLGLAASSKVYMSKLDKYSELIAEKGSYDVPAAISAGLAYKVTPAFTLTLDYEHIFYEDLKSVSNSGPVFTPGGGIGLPAGTSLLGMGNGVGFGWQNINIYRLGVKYDVKPNLTLRAGYSYNDTPILDEELLLNSISQAVIKRNVSVGFSYQTEQNNEWSFSYLHAFKEKQETWQSALGVPASVSMSQHILELGYSWNF